MTIQLKSYTAYTLKNVNINRKKNAPHLKYHTFLIVLKTEKFLCLGFKHTENAIFSFDNAFTGNNEIKNRINSA